MRIRMIKVSDCRVYMMLLLALLYYNNATSQSIRGDTIFLDVNKVVTVDFMSPPSKAELLPGADIQDGLYIVSIMGKNSISILATKKGKDQDLEVTEKDRKHLFILSYKEGSVARTLNLSNKRKVSERVAEAKKNTSKALYEADSLYEQAKTNTTNPALWKNIEIKYQRLVNMVDGNDADYVKSRLEESRKQAQDLNNTKYGEAVKEGQTMYALKKWSDAKKAYGRALDIRPGDPQALKWINQIDSVWAKGYVDQGDEANRMKKWVLAKNNYQKAREIKPDYPSLQEKFEQVKINADPLIYKTEKENGDEAMKAGELKEARRAYDAALSARPDDRYIKNQIRLLAVEEEKVALEEKNDSAYQNILVTAKRLADKASSAQQYDLAIKEYERAAGMIPDRKFPRKQIAALTKQKNSLRPN